MAFRRYTRLQLLQLSEEAWDRDLALGVLAALVEGRIHRNARTLLNKAGRVLDRYRAERKKGMPVINIIPVPINETQPGSSPNDPASQLPQPQRRH